jgi:hypothetical protein
MEFTAEKIQEIVSLVPGNKAVLALKDGVICFLYYDPKMPEYLAFDNPQFSSSLIRDMSELIIADDRALF